MLFSYSLFCSTKCFHYTPRHFPQGDFCWTCSPVLPRTQSHFDLPVETRIVSTPPLYSDYPHSIIDVHMQFSCISFIHASIPRLHLPLPKISFGGWWTKRITSYNLYYYNQTSTICTMYISLRRKWKNIDSPTEIKIFELLWNLILKYKCLNVLK